MSGPAPERGATDAQRGPLAGPLSAPLPPASRIGYLDCYSGVSGNMLLGALLDAGLPADALEAALAGLGLAGAFRLAVREVQRSGVRATHVEVVTDPGQPHRTFAEVARIVAGAGLPPALEARSLAVLRRLAEVEGHIHGAAPEAVELHEVGALDAIVDVVGSVVGLHLLGVETLYASPLPLAPGSITHHGRAYPGPGPATLELLAAAGAPLRPFGAGHELVTPTGAALVATLATFAQPPLTLERVGYGAGSAELPWPNVLRLWLGRAWPAADADADGRAPAAHVVLETNLDDMSPQLLAPLGEACFAAGALDVTMTPLVMKKGRPGHLVSVIARAADEAALAALLLRETTTLGVRVHPVRRHEAGRAFRQVETPYGQLPVKCKLLDGEIVAAVPEFEAVRALAARRGVPLQQVHAAATAAGLALLGERPGDEPPGA